MAAVDKKNMTLEEICKQIDKMTDSINKANGRTVVATVGRNQEMLEDLKLKFLPSCSPEFNNMVGGGFPCKKITLIFGKESSGKTGFLLQTIKEAQEKDDKFMALWLETEKSLDEKTLIGMGIDMNRFTLMKFNNDIGGEKAIDQALAVFNTGFFDIFVINSLKALTPKAEIENEIEKDTIALQARMNSKIMKKLNGDLENANAPVIITSHLSTNIGGYMSGGDVQSGGYAIRYFATLNVNMNKGSLQANDPINQEDGFKILMTVKKNRCLFGENPYKKCETYCLYNGGFDKVFGTLNSAIDKGYISKAGAYLSEIEEVVKEDGSVVVETKEFKGTPCKWCGKAKFKEFCEQNPDYLQYLQNRVFGFVLNDYETTQSLTNEEVAAIEHEEGLANEATEKVLAELEDEEQKVELKKKTKKK